MRTYVATILETRRRRLRLVAGSADQAMAMLARTHGRDVRVQTITPVGATDLRAAATALLTLLDAEFLALAGRSANLREWLATTVEGPEADRDARNDQLAIAGLRLRFDAGPRLVVGSARSIPFLAEAMRGTAFEGEALLATLALIPGAEKGSVTLAGIRTRAVSIPWGSVVSASVMGGPGMGGGA